MNNNLKRLDSICDITISSIDKKSKPNETAVKLCNFTDVYYNWVIYSSTAQNFMSATASEKDINSLSLQQGDVCITKDSETRDDIGMSTYIAETLENVVLGYHCALIRPRLGLNGAYLNAYLNSYLGRKYFENQASGSGQRYTLTKESIGSIKISAPSLSAQTAIAKLLLDIDKKISKNKQINDNLEKQAKLIYDYWFNQFEFPDENDKPYRSSGGKMKWNKELGREIPEGWKVESIYLIAELINGLACQKYRPKIGEKSLPVVKIKEMHDGVTSETEKVSANIPAKYIINDGDILFSWSATLEVTYWYGGEAGLNQHIFKVVPNKGFPREYVYHQLKEYIGIFSKIALSKKTTMGHITSDHIKQSRITIAPESLASKYANVVLNISNKIKILNKERKELLSLRDYLLPLLMNGQAILKDE